MRAGTAPEGETLTGHPGGRRRPEPNASEAAVEFADALRRIRLLQGLRLEDVAERASLSRQHVNGIELVYAEPTPDTLGRLAEALTIPPDRLADLVLRRRIMEALEQHGLSRDDREFVWNGIRQRLDERGRRWADSAEIIAAIVRSS